jgi:hypothetical protein
LSILQENRIRWGDGFSVEVTDKANEFRKFFRRFIVGLKHQGVSATEKTGSGATWRTTGARESHEQLCGAQRAVQHARSGGATCRTTGAHDSDEQLCDETNVTSIFAGAPNPLGDGFSAEVTDDANGFRKKFPAIYREARRQRVSPAKNRESRNQRKRCCPFFAGGIDIKVFSQPKIGSRALNGSGVLRSQIKSASGTAGPRIGRGEARSEICKSPGQRRMPSKRSR